VETTSFWYNHQCQKVGKPNNLQEILEIDKNAKENMNTFSHCFGNKDIQNVCLNGE
jgi:hypothetical protein